MKTVTRQGIDHDPVKPWNWATFGIEGDPVEIVSYPIPADDIDCTHQRGRCRCTVMVRRKVGDPTSLREVPLRLIAAFSPDRHEWILRERRYDSDNPTAFIFVDELPSNRSREQR
jgi:hypothetical protein